MTDREAIDVLFNEWKCIDRNDGIHCDRKCESCDLVMDVEIIREAYNMAISALQEQEAKHSTESSSTHKALDTISRQAAINTVKKHYRVDNDLLEVIVYQLENLPSAQPEPCEDCVSRQAAIDAALSAFSRGLLASPDIRRLPSVQQQPQWIPVSKKSHPDTPERVQVQLDNGWIITAYYEENEWLSVPYCDEPIEDRWIEAWMPLPEPYRAERRTDDLQ